MLDKDHRTNAMVETIDVGRGKQADQGGDPMLEDVLESLELGQMNDFHRTSAVDGHLPVDHVVNLIRSCVAFLYRAVFVAGLECSQCLVYVEGCDIVGNVLQVQVEGVVLTCRD